MTKLTYRSIPFEIYTTIETADSGLFGTSRGHKVALRGSVVDWSSKATLQFLKDFRRF